ncbi:MAG: TPM domain-containing protein [Clostridia bacterium]|nr:TPM domain-containing protein [Clostridia bacterium]
MSKKIISLMLIILVLISMPISYAVTSLRNTTITNTQTTDLSGSYSNYIENEKNLNNESSKYKVIIEDDANLLTEVEESQLKAQMNELTEYGNIVFKSINDNHSTTASYASKYYHQTLGTQSGTLFLIDMDNRKIYIFSDGENYKTITSSKAETITDNIYTYATKKQYYQCAKEAFSQIYILLEGGKIAEPMKYISNGLIAIMLALFVNFVIFRSVTKAKATGSGELLKECESYFEHTPPEVTETGEHRVYSPIESSSGGGGGFSGGGRRWRIFRRRRRPQFLIEKVAKRDRPFWQLFMIFSSVPKIIIRPISFFYA